MPNGTRRGTTYTRNGATVRARSASIRRPRAQGSPHLVYRRRRQGEPLLFAAGAAAAAGALTAILTGRWGAAFVLFGAAGALGVSHLVWQRHKRRQAGKPAKQKRAPEKREALEKAREAHQPEPAAESGNDRGGGWVKHGTTKYPPALSKTHEHPVVIAQRNGTAPAAANRQPVGTVNGAKPPAEPKSHAEWQTRYGKRCDCRECREQRKADRAEKAEVLR